MTEVNLEIKNTIQDNDVVLFMKGSKESPMCGFSASVVRILNAVGVEFKDVNVLSSDQLREEIKIYSNWPTIPQLYIKQEFIGGCDIIVEMYKSGELQKKLVELELAR